MDIQVSQVGKVQSTPEILPYIPNAALDFAFGLSTIWAAWMRCKAAVRGIIQIAFVPDYPPCSVVGNDSTFEIVVQDLLWHIPKILKGMLVTANEPVCVAIHREFDVHRS